MLRWFYIGHRIMREPFSRFASYYDKFMVKYVDYKGWVDYLEKLFRRFSVQPKSVLDVACGTGIPAIILAKRGYRVTGVDRSPEMLAILEEKRGRLPISTVRADIRGFAVAEQSDAAVSLYDSINYLLVEEDLVRCFACVRRALAEHGLFAFDMNTVYGLAEFWGTRTTMRETGGIQSVWCNTYDAESRVSSLHLTFWEAGHDRNSSSNSGSCPQTPDVQKFEELHQERAYFPEEVERSLRRAGFREVYFYQHGSFIAPGPYTTRMMVVAR
jgi:SAM-dependent methyltransferase